MLNDVKLCGEWLLNSGYSYTEDSFVILRERHSHLSVSPRLVNI